MTRRWWRHAIGACAVRTIAPMWCERLLVRAVSGPLSSVDVRLTRLSAHCRFTTYAIPHAVIA